MASVTDITDCPIVPLGRILDRESEIARAQLLPGVMQSAALPMLWSTGVAEIDGFHAPSAFKTSDIEVYAVTNATICGSGGHVMRDGHYIWAAGAYPHYIRVLIENDLNSDTWANVGTTIKKIPTAFAITHFNYVWGHWLLEIYPKLFVIRRLSALGITAPIVIPCSAPSYIKKIIAETLPGQQILEFDPNNEIIFADTLLLPDMMSRDYMFHAALNRDLKFESKKTVRFWGKKTRRIFVSREYIDTKSGYRELSNASALEKIAKSYDFTVVHPEFLSWREQIEIFANANVIVGEFGSGMHNTIFSPAGAKIITFNWIVELQSRIANFRRQRIGYILPDDGETRRHRFDQPLQVFSIDPDEFAARLEGL